MDNENVEKYRENGHINLDKYFTDYEFKFINKENRGTPDRIKEWLEIEGTEQLVRTENYKDENNRPTRYSRFAELIIEQLAKQVDIPCAECDLIIYKGEYGIMSRNVVSKENESLVSMLDMIDTMNYNLNEDYEGLDPSQPVSIDEIFDACKYTLEQSNIDKKTQQELNFSVAQIGIFDAFVMAEDRNMQNIGILYGGNGINVSPIFDNECSLMLATDITDIQRLLEDKKRLEIHVEFQNQLITIPEEERDLNGLDWEEFLYYLCDNSERCMNFAKKCSDNLDIEDAIRDVESNVNYELPSDLKEYIRSVFMLRMEKIRYILGFEREHEHENNNILE